jgi:flavorubredoxin
VLFDDEHKDLDAYTAESLRYYSNIIAKFSPQVSKMIDKLKVLSPKIIAPAHGLVWRKDPAKIVDLYKKWADYAVGKAERGVTLLYASMYGNTAQATNAVVRGLQSVSVPVNVFDVSQTHLSYILPSLWTNAGVIIGSPTYEGNIFPTIRHVLVDAGLKHVYNKTAAFFGSWSWSSGALREIKELVEPFEWNLVDDLEFEGAAKESILERAFELGAAFGTKLK